MKVYIDDQIFYMQERGGISRYFVELMRAYREDRSLGVRVTGRPVGRKNKHLHEAGLDRKYHLGPATSKVTKFAQDYSWRFPKPDVVHHTQYHDLAYLERHPDALRVVTVYDMIPEAFPQDYVNGSPHFHKREFVDAADLVLCISESTKRELIHHYGTPADKVVAIPLGVDAAAFSSPGPKPADLPERYVLNMGDRGGYKDFATLAQAFAAADIPDEVQLVTVGGAKVSRAERNQLSELGIADRFHRVRVQDQDLAAVYANALCFVFPSVMEGFGLPTLEAMAAGCPTIVSSADALLEVSGTASATFTAGDYKALAVSLSEVVGDPALRQSLIDAGHERARLFPWAKTAKLTAEAYRAALANNELVGKL